MSELDSTTRIHRPRFQRGYLRLRRKTWWLRYRGSDGRETYKRIGSNAQYKTKAAARLTADRFLAELNPHHAVNSRSVRLNDFANEYISAVLPLLKPTSAKSVKSIITKHIVPYFGDVYLEGITLQMQQRFVTHLHSQDLSGKTIANAVVVLSRLCSQARKYGHAAPVIDRGDLKMPPAGLDQPRRFFTPEESARIIEAAEYPFKALYGLLAHLGLRAGEALGVRWRDIDLESKIIHVLQSVVEGRIQTVKSRNSKAILPLADRLAAILITYKSVWQPNDLDLLFADECGRPLRADNVRMHQFTPLLKQLGIDHGGLHGFRHGCATNLLNAGVPIHTVKAILRHGTIGMTATYSHTVLDDQRKAVERSADQILCGTSGAAHG